ncbi:ArsR/SmtB family transcription factor [Demequina activiva]|uniref:Transcriptional regulator n=1 Tax=Demequina activiva TaxID=1582364 RepID=A0A919Q2X7_9MICO|nr:metalloregulator ArsR/SmtB family transcription factor [Demequina activiva]GIG55267.1 transcriptional regulator [Demequina activiva]
MIDDELSVTFAALADPTRRAILQRLADGPATVKELAAPFTMSGPAISKHLRVLQDAGLITMTQDGQTRPRALEPAALGRVADWTTTMQRTWETRHDRLATYLAELQEKDTP